MSLMIRRVLWLVLTLPLLPFELPAALIGYVYDGKWEFDFLLPFPKRGGGAAV